MRDVVIIGGMGAGKSTLCKALGLAVPQSHYLYAGKYIAQLPFALHRKNPDLFLLPRATFIDTVLANQDMPIPPARREDLNTAAERAFAAYGELVEADLVLRARKTGVPNVIDSLACVVNVERAKQEGLYLVGLECSFETQVQRCLARRKDIDPTDKAGIDHFVRWYNDILHVDQTLPLAHKRYTTDNHSITLSEMVEEIAHVMRE